LAKEAKGVYVSLGKQHEVLVNLKSEEVGKYGLGSDAGMKVREECYQK